MVKKGQKESKWYGEAEMIEREKVQAVLEGTDHR
jgi:hypothetical protein